MATCEDHGYVRREILDVAEQTHFDWWQLWISSGILSSILLKAAVANFGLALLRCADPFSLCDGSFLVQPKPTKIPQQQQQQPSSSSSSSNEDAVLPCDWNRLKLQSEMSIRWWAFGSAVFWGLCIVVMIVNLILVHIQRIGGMKSLGYHDSSKANANTLWSLIGLSFITVTVTWGTTRFCYLQPRTRTRIRRNVTVRRNHRCTTKTTKNTVDEGDGEADAPV